MSIQQNINRVGNFTSSEIVALLSTGSRPMTENELAEYKKTNPKSQKKNITDGFGGAALSYIEECNIERRLGRSLSDESRAKPITWGKLLERRCFDLLPLNYALSSQETIIHPTIPYWVGSPDGEKEPDTVVEMKCPFTLKSFCTLVQPLYDGLSGIDAMNKIRETHQDGEKFYQQCISNAILKRKRFVELIIYMPYKSELEEIKLMAMDSEIGYWIWAALENELPFLMDGGYYQNINIIRFEPPESDRRLLTERVLDGGKLLIDRHESLSVLIASPGDGVTLIEPSK